MNIYEYIIIWLIYMLNLKDGNPISNLNVFFVQYKNKRGGPSLISTNSKDYSNVIDNLIFNNNYLVDMNKNIIYKFYNLLKSLCSMYNDINKDTKLLNNNDFDTDGSSHRTLLSSLSTDYNNLKNKYGNNKSCDFPSIPKIVPIKNSAQPTALSPEATSSSSSILNTLIPGLSTFSAIPVFLGIAYKYSVFGFDKRLQREYLREKIKKITKKMNNYI
ncbi:hypothetical protein YYE_03995 [Plasmodium vinckei vinckei]|uniref:CIR protein PIR protein n=1 Tax=Plasmodium vinckei vinckei TaxID=54757 RepID=A0A081IBA4_PLAVN|nr:hypothetical protein YYE_03995 [Plasmodium vinckei vinckei]